MRLLLLSCLAVFLAACGAKPRAGAFVLEVALPGRMDPPKSDAVNGYSIIVGDWIFEPILRVSEDGSSIPGLTSVTAHLPDGSVQLTLRPGATFSDGSAVTPEDVAGAIAKRGFMATVRDGAVVASALELRIPIEQILPTVNVGKISGNEELGSGPFRVAEHEGGHFVVRRRVNTPGRINEIRLTAYANEREALARVLRGDANLLPQIQVRDIEFFEGVPRVQIVHGLAPHAIAVVMGPTLTLAERLAVVRALPVNELSSTVFDQSCRPWPHGSAGAAMPAGRPLRILTFAANAELSRLGLALRRALGDRAGELTALSNEGALNALEKGDFDLATMTPLIWPVGMAALSLHTGSQLNVLHYSNEEVDAALEQGNWLRALDALDRDPPLVFVCTEDRVVVVDSRIKNPVLGPWGLLERLPEWEVGE